MRISAYARGGVRCAELGYAGGPWPMGRAHAKRAARGGGACKGPLRCAHVRRLHAVERREGPRAAFRQRPDRAGGVAGPLGGLEGVRGGRVRCRLAERRQGQGQTTAAWSNGVL